MDIFPLMLKSMEKAVTENLQLLSVLLPPKFSTSLLS